MPRAVVTGGAGFVGSHLCRALVGSGYEVIAVDDLSSGRVQNVADLLGNAGFSFVEHDVSLGLPIDGRVDAVLHLASPASPPDYLARPLETLAVGSEGTRHCLELAVRHRVPFLLTSTSEVYGDPTVHPQREDYWGNVNPIGLRSVYDEAKRFAEALTMAYRRVHGIDTKIARLFNTYGPGLRPADGRVVSNFITQALDGAPLTIYGDGSQTRSLCYIDDTVAGLVALLHGDTPGPVNVGNPDEYTVSEIAALIIEISGSKSAVTFEPLPLDDPTRRCPDISLAKEQLGWEPVVKSSDGLERTIEWFRANR